MGTQTPNPPVRRRTTNPWVLFCVEIYWAAKRPQLDRLEQFAIGYATEERTFYTEVESRVTFRDTLVRCSPEWRAQQWAK